MRYMLMIYTSEAMDAATTPAQEEELMAAYGAYTQALQQANALVSAERLKPTDTATLVRVAQGRTEVLNGPYAETKEQLGGYYLIDVANLDDAIAWAARCPSAGVGTIEVRPVWEM